MIGHFPGRTVELGRVKMLATSSSYKDQNSLDFFRCPAGIEISNCHWRRVHVSRKIEGVPERSGEIVNIYQEPIIEPCDIGNYYKFIGDVRIGYNTRSA
jgi:hypothetical protein